MIFISLIFLFFKFLKIWKPELEEIIDDIKYQVNKEINDISTISTQSIIKNEVNEEIIH